MDTRHRIYFRVKFSMLAQNQVIKYLKENYRVKIHMPTKKRRYSLVSVHKDDAFYFEEKLRQLVDYRWIDSYGGILFKEDTY